MIRREDLEQKEMERLSPFAALSVHSRGRAVPEEACDIRTEYQRDRDRILHSKSFRRLMHKTQVFLSPEGDHFRTRLTHTLEVAQIARTVARALALNEDLTEAIALGHDLGHTPFGHNGEEVLNQCHPGGFQHNEQSLRVVEVLETNGSRRGMNLTFEVREGIVNHTGSHKPVTLEGQVVRYSDRIAYINHDIDDAIRGGIIREKDLPLQCVEALGSDHRSRINTLVNDLVEHSDGMDRIIMSKEREKRMNELRAYMFEHVYHSRIVKKDEELDKIRNLIVSLYGYFKKNPDRLPDEFQQLIGECGIDCAVKDHIAGMTDRYAVHLFKEVYVPEGWK